MPLLKEAKGKLEDGVYIEKGVRVAMQKKGRQVSLLEFDPILSCSYDGKLTALDFSDTAHCMRHLNSVSEATSYKSGIFFATADKDENGEISTKLLVCYFPKVIRLRTNHPDSGFILYTPKKDYYAKQIREMAQAPENGYQSELELSISKDTFYNRGMLYFWFKIDGKYGKGYITDARYYGQNGKYCREGEDPALRGKGTMEINMCCEMNPDGTRDLEQKEWQGK